jgi:hypothetical protein
MVYQFSPQEWSQCEVKANIQISTIYSPSETKNDAYQTLASGCGGQSDAFPQFTGRGQLEWHWRPKVFLAGALIFLSPFITRRRNGNDGDMGAGAGS